MLFFQFIISRPPPSHFIWGGGRGGSAFSSLVTPYLGMGIILVCTSDGLCKLEILVAFSLKIYKVVWGELAFVLNSVQGQILIWSFRGMVDCFSIMNGWVSGANSRSFKTISIKLWHVTDSFCACICDGYAVEPLVIHFWSDVPANCSIWLPRLSLSWIVLNHDFSSWWI